MAIRVALDANVLLAGIVWPRWPHQVLLHALRGDFTLVLSPIVIEEARRRIRQRFPDFQQDFELWLLTVRYELAPVPTEDEIATHHDLVRQKRRCSGGTFHSGGWRRLFCHLRPRFH